MSLDKAIKHGKEHRKEYHGAKAVDPSCRNHGNCGWCQESRMHKHKKKEQAMEDRRKEQEDE